MSTVPEGDIRPKRAKKRYVSESRVEQFKSYNGLMTATRYQKGGDALRVQRTYDAAEQLIATEEAVYILKAGRTTKIHEWGHGPGIYIPF